VNRSRVIARRDILGLAGGVIPALLAFGPVRTASTARVQRTFYVDRHSGSDSASGTSPESAWQSLASVNAHRFQPGDAVLLRRGQVWTDGLRPQGSGRPTTPIVLGAYGDGPRPRIEGDGRRPALALHDQEGWVVRDLALTGPGQPGLQIDTSERVQSFFQIINVEVSRATDGIAIGQIREGDRLIPGYVDDVLIEQCVVHDVTHRGIVTAGNFGSSGRRHRNVRVHASEVFNCGRDGILVTSTSGAVIEDCVAHDCGMTADGRYGIWAWWADHVTIQRCEAYRIRTTGVKDGGGFDLDWGTADCVVQHCYAHDNDGPGFAIVGLRQGPATAPQRNIVRYNVARGNCVKRTRERYGEVTLFGGMDDVAVYNNTIHGQGGNRNGSALMLSGWWRESTDWPRRVVIRNNILTVEQGPLLRVDPEAAQPQRLNSLDHDVFHASHGPLDLGWGRRSYDTLSEFVTATGQERHGAAVAPGLTAPAETVGAGRLPLLGYRIRRDSPCVDRGTVLPGHGTRDYWGGMVPAGTAPDVGAHELGGGGGRG